MKLSKYAFFFFFPQDGEKINLYINPKSKIDSQPFLHWVTMQDIYAQCSLQCLRKFKERKKKTYS